MRRKRKLSRKPKKHDRKDRSHVHEQQRGKQKLAARNRKREATMSPEEYEVWRSCTSKRRYLSRATAESALQTGMIVYNCRFCDGWHRASRMGPGRADSTHARHRRLAGQNTAARDRPTESAQKGTHDATREEEASSATQEARSRATHVAVDETPGYQRAATTLVDADCKTATDAEC